METKDAADMLAALSYEARLMIFRYLVRMGPEGACAGDIAKDCEITASTLSHHLNQMRNAGLIERTRQSRSLIYVANFNSMNALIDFLSDECCNGQPELCR
ncbi:Transcriptional regulator, ArsR family [Candidatus Terasakiella magnetica]|uniref:Transcriptional regulator, ArsR family n=1 Tax=Candidatus Terasakiella magnetica TaxID=1867952 RepID=A0A1C3REY6_9PROT|nr:metalloregulator ArsR/SmtB family transcription factor [Candidatus Terasakiella magnetica]SCA55847.1 Transcriptional regulator, ArsR family [Candidatus Terasakiella magnetica]